MCLRKNQRRKEKNKSNRVNDLIEKRDDEVGRRQEEGKMSYKQEHDKGL